MVFLSAWPVSTPEIIEIPGEESLLPVSLLFDKLHGTESLDYSKFEDTLVAETIHKAISSPHEKISLRDTSDLICPLAALMAISSGGEIIDAKHVRGKESNRIISTIRMLSSFGIEVEERKDGLSISGGQYPRAPSETVFCEDDHRLAMTALVLATKVGAELSGHEICDVSHPGFFEMIMPKSVGA